MEIHLDIDGTSYTIRYAAFPEKFFSIVLCLVSYMPNEQTENLVRIAVASLKKHTTTPYTLCVVDNASPEERLLWLRQQEGVVLLENRTPPAPGSYANAVGLEIARRMIPADTQYFMSLHQDIMITRDGWLEYLLSKFNNHIRAVGVREDKIRTPQGILHVLGYIVDFQLLNELNLDYFPRLPQYDVGDYIIDTLRRKGFGYFVAHNAIWHPELLKYVSKEFRPLIFNKHKTDFVFDDEYNVFFLHFGRGVLKTTNTKDYMDFIQKWFSVASNHLGMNGILLCEPTNNSPVNKNSYFKNIVKIIIKKGYHVMHLQKFFAYCKVFLGLEDSTRENKNASSKPLIFNFSPNDEKNEYFSLQIARTLQQLHRLNSSDTQRKCQRLKILHSYLDFASIKKALVVGCRDATELDLLEEVGVKNVYGIDLVSVDKRIYPCDMHNITAINNKSVDFIFSSHSLEHSIKPYDVLKEFKRIIIPSGKIFIEVPIHFTPRGSDLHDFHSANEIEKMLIDIWDGGRCLLKQEMTPEEANMGTSIARVLFETPK